MRPPPLTLLYVPADRPDRLAKALASAADVVLVDLEDAVAPSHKDEARGHAVAALRDVGERPVQVRINRASTPWHDADLAALAALPVAVGARVPKVESPEQVRAVAEVLPGRALHLLVESALGVERTFDIATASPQVASVGLGEADLRSDLRVDDAGLAWARGRVVVAARAAGLPSPVMSAYPNVRDLDGLAESCRTGRELGFCGRTAIHPAQLDVIRHAFLPTQDEVAAAAHVVARVEGAAEAGVGALALADGTFLDVAMVERARAVLALAERTGDGES